MFQQQETLEVVEHVKQALLLRLENGNGELSRLARSSG